MNESRADRRDAPFEHLVRYGGDRHPAVIARAQGCTVTDEDGREILDFTSGQMCSTLGHNHPRIVAAIRAACDTVLHLFSGMIPRTVVDLADRLAALLPAPLARMLFVSTGGESNEAAIKMAKLHTGGFEVVALGGSWHGAGGAAAAVSYASDRRGHGPPLPGVHLIPEPNAYRCPVRHCRDLCDMTCLDVGLALFDQQSVGAPAAMIAEPILSAGGVVVPPEGYFARLHEACRQRGLLLIVDEAQTAFGRLGEWFAIDRLGVVPDLLTVSKTLGGGIPLAATITSAEIEERCHARGFAFYTSHVSDPLPAAVGLAVVDTLTDERLLDRARLMGKYLRNALEQLQARHAEIGDVRGAGLLLGVELVRDRETREPHHGLGERTTRRCLELGLSMNIRRRPDRGAVWRIAPPLTVTFEEVDRAVAIIDQALDESKDVLACERR
jgi:2,2-dialkylglycine decarboxylase (pyruvate)